MMTLVYMPVRLDTIFCTIAIINKTWKKLEVFVSLRFGVALKYELIQLPMVPMLTIISGWNG